MLFLSMRKLNPSARLKKRYLLIDSEKARVERAILDYIGILGWAKASPVFVSGKKTILAIDRKEILNVRAALEAAGLRVLRVSGTLKGLGK